MIKVILDKYERVFDGVLNTFVFMEQDRDDARQDLAIMLLEAASRYKPGKGAVSTFVSANIEIFIKRFKRDRAIQTLKEGITPYDFDFNSVSDVNFAEAVDTEIDRSIIRSKLEGDAKSIYDLVCQGYNYSEISNILKINLRKVYEIKDTIIKSVIKLCYI